MSLDSRLIDELARRRELGAYFDYAGYRELRRVESISELKTSWIDKGLPAHRKRLIAPKLRPG
jgi:hypothetical protein